MNELKEFIQELGFPIFIAVWMMWERIVIIRRMIDSMDKNTVATNRLVDKLDGKI